MSVDRHAVPNFMMCDSKCVRLDVHGMGQINLTRRKRIITINTLFVFFPLDFFCFFFVVFVSGPCSNFKRSVYVSKVGVSRGDLITFARARGWGENRSWSMRFTFFEKLEKTDQDDLDFCCFVGEGGGEKGPERLAPN